MKADYGDVGKLVRQWVEKEFGTQLEASKAVGIGKSKLNLIITGKRKATHLDIIKFRQAGFDITVFDSYYNLPNPKVGLTITEYIGIIENLKIVIRQLNSTIEFKDIEISNLHKDIVDWKLEVHELRQRLAEATGSNIMPRKFYKE